MTPTATPIFFLIGVDANYFFPFFCAGLDDANSNAFSSARSFSLEPARSLSLVPAKQNPGAHADESQKVLFVQESVYADVC